MSRPAFVLPLILLFPLATAAAAAAGVFGSVEDFSRAVALKPGGWHVSMKPVWAQVEATPAADPAEVAAMKAEIEPQVGTVEEVDECVDPASAGGPRLPGILVERGCTYGRLEAADGRWAMASTCPTLKKGGTVILSGEGTYAPDLVTGRHEARIPMRGFTIHIKAETVSRFVGECRSPAPIAQRPAPDEK